MTRLSMLSLALAASLAGLTAACADEATPSDRAIAEAWLDAYSRQDFDAMGALMTEDTVFVDPTSFGIEAVTNRIEWQGPEAITSGIRGWGMDHGVYTIDRTYEASGQVVFNGHVDVFYGQGDAAQTYRYPITTIITVEDGHVREHRDYTDFNGARRVEVQHH